MVPPAETCSLTGEEAAAWFWVHQVTWFGKRGLRAWLAWKGLADDFSSLKASARCEVGIKAIKLLQTQGDMGLGALGRQSGSGGTRVGWLFLNN